MNRPSIDWQITKLRYINRTMFGLALLGILDTIHLYVQKQFGFNKGCLGFFDSAIEQSFNCHQVVTSEAGTFFGLSNTLLGIAFFVLFSLLLFLRMYKISNIRTLLNFAIKTGLTLAFTYACYLFYYQSVVLNEYCLLCLISASIITCLFLLELSRYFLKTDREEYTPDYVFRREKKIRLAISAAVVLLGIADLTIAQLQSPPSSPDSSTTVYSIQADTLSLTFAKPINISRPPVTGCTYQDTIQSSKDGLISFYDPLYGSAGSQVSLVLYFDPLHESTKPLLATMDTLVKRWPERLEIALKPVAITSSSLPAVSALYLAHKQGKFSRFLNAMISYNKKKLKAEQLISLSAHQADLDTTDFDESRSLKLIAARIYMEKEKAKAVEVKHVPTLFINQYKVGINSLSRNCILKLVEKTFHSMQ